jgi:ribose/xylose/arabinose/galactoside ABC-type transport system permease subunit
LHHLGEQFTNGLARGAGWSIGERIVHALPIAVLLIIALLAVGWFVLRRTTR